MNSMTGTWAQSGSLLEAEGWGAVENLGEETSKMVILYRDSCGIRDCVDPDAYFDTND